VNASLERGVAAADRVGERPPEYRYHLLRAALAAGLPALAGLAEHQRADIVSRADQTFDLESLVLTSPEAAEVVFPQRRLADAMAELSGRYPDRAAFLADLADNGLDEETLRRALHRELVFDGALRRAAARRAAVSEVDEWLFFELHRNRFTQPERRTARHILITVNEAFAENRRNAARARIERLARQLAGRPQRFAALARKHSECPSAAEGGRLGTVPRGRLYAELDAVLFSLQEGEISGPIASEIGFHLLWCEDVRPGCSVPFAKARPRIRELLQQRAARDCQKTWLAELQRARANQLEECRP